MFVSVVSGCVSISVFASLVGSPIDVASFALCLKIFVLLQQLKSISQWLWKKKKDKIVLSAKSKSNTIEVLIYKALIDACIYQDEFFLANNVLKEDNEVKEVIKNFENMVSDNL